MGDKTPPLNLRDLYAVVACTPLQLPQTITTNYREDLGSWATLFLPEDCRAGVDAWAAEYAGTTVLGPITREAAGRVRCYDTEVTVAGWAVRVCSYLHADTEAVES